MNDIVIEHVCPSSDSERLEKLLWELDCVINPKLSERVNIKDYALKLSEKAELFYVRFGEKDIGNCAIYMNGGSIGFISSIALKKEWQNKGIGKRLWRAIVTQAKTKRIQVIELLVYEKNDTAINFYKKLGFKKKEIDNSWITMWYEVEK